MIDLKPGDKITIEGFGKSARGHDVMNGRSVKTGRKMKVKTLTEFRLITAATSSDHRFDLHYNDVDKCSTVED